MQNGGGGGGAGAGGGMNGGVGGAEGAESGVDVKISAIGEDGSKVKGKDGEALADLHISSASASEGNGGGGGAQGVQGADLGVVPVQLHATPVLNGNNGGGPHTTNEGGGGGGIGGIQGLGQILHGDLGSQQGGDNQNVNINNGNGFVSGNAQTSSNSGGMNNGFGGGEENKGDCIKNAFGDCTGSRKVTLPLCRNLHKRVIGAITQECEEEDSRNDISFAHHNSLAHSRTLRGKISYLYSPFHKVKVFT